MSELLRKHIEQITSLTDDEFKHILSHFVPKKYKKHQFIVQEDEPVINDFWIVHGSIKSFYIDKDGKEHIIQFGIEDWWITDYYAYFNQLPAVLYAQCLEDCELLCLSLTNREKLCDEFHKMSNFFRKKGNAGYVALQRRILGLLSKTPKERFVHFTGMYPSLLQRIPKKYIAAYLGVSRETLSRLKNFK